MARSAHEFYRIGYILLQMGMPIEEWQDFVDATKQDSIGKKLQKVAMVDKTGTKMVLPEQYKNMPFDDFVQHECRRSFTRGTAPDEVVRTHLPFKYNMTLMRNDMVKLLEILNAGSATISEGTLEWAGDFRASILETIGLEEI